jgi:hypothetical protein
MARLLVLMLCWCACAGPPETGPPATAPGSPVPADAGLPPAADASGPAISEAHARQIVTRALRDAGLRVLFDVEVELGNRRLTLDGFDPKRQIGFEYSAASERQSNGKAPTSSEVRVLWIEASSEAQVRRRTREFIAEHLAADASPD